VKKVVVAVLLFVCVALGANATYVVLLKNGERVVGQRKYTVKGGVATMVLKNGTLTSMPLSLIDVTSTEKLNALHLGDAVPLPALDANGERVVPTPFPTPAVTSLGHIRPDLGRPVGSAAQATPTPGIGYRATHYPDEQVDQAFQQGLESYHLYLYRTGVGTQPNYYFLEIQVNGQAEVVRALEAVTTTYNLLVQKAPDRAPARVELQLLNEAGREAGVFRLSPENAAELANGKIKAEDFFVKYVIF
jgi:hypothetical protein